MGKLKLDLDSLAVECFETTQPDENEGTVFGNQVGRNQWVSLFNVTCDQTCPPCGGGGIGTWWPTCNPGLSCGNTCIRTCQFTCGQATCGFTCYRTCHLSCHVTCAATCQLHSCAFHCTVNVSCHICTGTFQG
jgi:hypothetical protein